jgi:hypothetical protein
MIPLGLVFISATQLKVLIVSLTSKLPNAFISSLNPRYLLDGQTRQQTEVRSLQW